MEPEPSCEGDKCDNTCVEGYEFQRVDEAFDERDWREDRNYLTEPFVFEEWTEGEVSQRLYLDKRPPNLATRRMHLFTDTNSGSDFGIANADWKYCFEAGTPGYIEFNKLPWVGALGIHLPLSDATVLELSYIGQDE